MDFTGFDHLKRWEGCELQAYKDVAGVWTIGYGSTGSHVSPGLTITQKQADDLLLKDLVRFEKAVNDGVNVKLNQNQYDALVSLAFNIGDGAFLKSTLLRKLNSGDYVGAANELLRWNKAGGKVSAGLKNRGESERELFLKEVEKPANPPAPTAKPATVTLWSLLSRLFK